MLLRKAGDWPRRCRGCCLEQLLRGGLAPCPEHGSEEGEEGATERSGRSVSHEGNDGTCKGPEAGLCLATRRCSPEADVAGAECGTGRSGREGVRDV